MLLKIVKVKCKMGHLLKSKWINAYIEICQTIANLSYCTRKKVGSILVKDNRIISIGYNGTPSCFDNECEIDGITKSEVLHAESNCISKCAKSTESCLGATLFVTLSPCLECAKLIIQSGIVKVYYLEAYRDLEGIKLLEKANIECYEIH